jgi:hypothetical protein
MKRGLALMLCCLIGCAEGDADLEWVTPREDAPAPIGDAIELAVASSDADARAVVFRVDGTEIATCDPAQPDEDCKRDDVWRWTTVFTTAGDHALEATLLDADGNELATVSRTLHVVTELPRELLDDDVALDDDPVVGQPVEAPEPDDLGQLEAAGRGLLDPDRGYHSIFGGIQWRVTNQRVRLRSGTPAGSVSAVRACMNRYGGSIRKWADYYKLSRASVVATALTESSCTNPAGSSDGLSSGPMQVTASTCSALTGLSRTTCRVRMHTHPDFSFKVGAKYMGSSYQRSQHHRDPPKIAAAYNAGSLRKSYANRWHLVSTGNHIDRFVRHYNAYRAWEAQ